jgi:hypothetical protein
MRNPGQLSSMLDQMKLRLHIWELGQLSRICRASVTDCLPNPTVRLAHSACHLLSFLLPFSSGQLKVHLIHSGEQAEEPFSRGV